MFILKNKIFLFNFAVITLIFLIDRLSKIYLLNLNESGVEVNYYVLPFLNIYLVWNTGVGFGILSIEPSLFYHIITLLIVLINIFLIYLLFKSSRKNAFFLALVLGGSIGNMYDRLYYFAVPDFIDFHIGNFHWFIFNIADIFITIGIISLIVFELFNKDIYASKN